MSWFEDDPAAQEAMAKNRLEHEAVNANGLGTGAQYAAKGRVKLIKGTEAKMEKVNWIWPGWLARGKMHTLAGQKGAGKSTVVFEICSKITCGGEFPDGTTSPSGDILIWSGEDDINDTIAPRLAAAGADMDRVYFISGFAINGEERSFDPATDMPRLLEEARMLPKPVALLIDPIVSASSGDSHKNSETRRGLQPLVDLTAELNLATIGISHFTKGTQGRDPIERLTGSLAFGAIPRVVWSAAKGDNEDGPRRLIRIASNIGPSGDGYEYNLYQAPVPGHDFTAQRIDWGEFLKGSPLELLERKEDKAKKTRAAELLDTMLADGAVAVTDIQEAANANGISWPTIERAKKDAGNIAAKKASGFRKDGIGIPENIDGKAWCWHKTATTVAPWTAI